jgi:hypothetical protein
VGLIGPVFAFSLVAVVMLIVVTRGLNEPPAAIRAPSVAPRRGLWRDPRIRPFLLYAFVLISVQAVNVASLGFLVIDQLDLPPSRAQSFIGAAMMAGRSPACWRSGA